VVKAAENWRGNDTIAVGNSMTVQHPSGSEAVENARPKTRVRTPAIVMRDPRIENASQVVLVQWDHLCVVKSPYVLAPLNLSATRDRLPRR